MTNTFTLILKHQEQIKDIQQNILSKKIKLKQIQQKNTINI